MNKSKRMNAKEEKIRWGQSQTPNSESSSSFNLKLFGSLIMFVAILVAVAWIPPATAQRGSSITWNQLQLRKQMKAQQEQQQEIDRAMKAAGSDDDKPWIPTDRGSDTSKWYGP